MKNIIYNLDINIFSLILDGFGKLSCPGGVYEGQFAFGVKQGHGLMVWANGDEYDGDWAIDQMTGFGKLTSKTATYDGKWEASMVSINFF